MILVSYLFNLIEITALGMCAMYLYLLECDVKSEY